MLVSHNQLRSRSPSTQVLNSIYKVVLSPSGTMFTLIWGSTRTDSVIWLSNIFFFIWFQAFLCALSKWMRRRILCWGWQGQCGRLTLPGHLLLEWVPFWLPFPHLKDALANISFLMATSPYLKDSAAANKSFLIVGQPISVLPYSALCRNDKTV